MDVSKGESWTKQQLHAGGGAHTGGAGLKKQREHDDQLPAIFPPTLGPGQGPRLSDLQRPGPVFLDGFWVGSLDFDVFVEMKGFST